MRATVVVAVAALGLHGAAAPRGQRGGHYGTGTSSPSAAPLQGTRAADGTIVPPGPPLSEEPRDCGPQVNHCARTNWWVGNFPGGLRPAFQVDGDVRGSDEKQRSIVWCTEAAGPQSFVPSKQILAFEVPPYPDDPRLPTNEKEAHTSPRWVNYVVDHANNDGTYVTSNPEYTLRMDAARAMSNPQAL